MSVNSFVMVLLIADDQFDCDSNDMTKIGDGVGPRVKGGWEWQGGYYH